MHLDDLIADLQNLSRSFQNPEIAISLFPKIDFKVTASFETVEVLGNGLFGLSPTKRTKKPTKKVLVIQLR